MDPIRHDTARDAIPYLLQRIHEAPLERRSMLTALLVDTSDIACRHCSRQDCERCLTAR